MKITIEIPKERNPFAELASKRRAGSHRKTNKQKRLKENREVFQE